jgi:glucoamylase
MKLLRSATDGAVFDKIDAVEKRYARGDRENAVEIFTMARQIRQMTAGKRLRVLALEEFRLVWSADDWETARSTESRNLRSVGHFADIATMPGQAGRISFTVEWLAQERWEGTNFDVELQPPGQ